MIESILRDSRPLLRVWLISDLQQSRPEGAEACLKTAVDDFASLKLPCDQIWYLGDAVEGTDIDHLREMTRMQIRLLGSLKIPLRYVMGNHDFDLTLESGKVHLPFYEGIKQVKGWKTTEHPADFYFTDEIGPFLVVFLSDHADPAGKWVQTHSQIHGDKSAYPHGEQAYANLRNLIANSARPTILAAHYAFAGGNRPSATLNKLLPLPGNVRLHIHGHAHIGDAQWVGENRYRKIAGIDNHRISQVDIASLENGRGDQIRSAILEIHEGQSLGVFFRAHETRTWEEGYMDQRR